MNFWAFITQKLGWLDTPKLLYFFWKWVKTISNITVQCTEQTISSTKQVLFYPCNFQREFFNLRTLWPAQGWQLNSKNYLRNKCTLFRCLLRRFEVWKIFSPLPILTKKNSSGNKIQIITLISPLRVKSIEPKLAHVSVYHCFCTYW